MKPPRAVRFGLVAERFVIVFAAVAAGVILFETVVGPAIDHYGKHSVCTAWVYRP